MIVALLSPARATSLSAANTSRIAAGSARLTSLAPGRRTANVSPKRARQSSRNAVGRSIHSSVCTGIGSRGPGGMLVADPAAADGTRDRATIADLPDPLTDPTLQDRLPQGHGQRDAPAASATWDV
ncbi:MAG: hypothetical protein ACRDRZ_15875 [Pseudonocardiaceae bacterium]